MIKMLDAHADKIRRIFGRDRAQALLGGYEGASHIERDLAHWRPELIGPNLEVEQAKDTLDARARDLFKNEGAISSGVRVIQDRVAGSNFRFVSSPNMRILGFRDEAWESEFREELEAKFTAWAESPEAYVDARGMATLTEIVRLAVAVELLSGEFLMAFNWLRDRQMNGSPYRTVVAPIELDRLMTPYERMDDPYVHKGVRVNKQGRPVGFYLTTQHPRDGMFQPHAAREWRYYRATTPWGRRRMLYLRTAYRPEQVRGVADLAAAMREVRLLRDFRLVTLQNAIVSASFAAVIESDLPPEVALASLGASPRGGEDAYIKAAQSYLSAVGKYVRGAQNLTLGGVKLAHLFPGSKLNLKPVGKVGGIGQEFERSLLRHVASVLGVSYEELARDFENTNYSSARAAMLQTAKSVTARRRFVAERVANAVLRAWFEEAAQLPPSEGGLETMQRRGLPGIYDGMNMDAYVAGRWLGPPMGHIDPLKEAQANALMVEAGLMTLEDALAQQGRDWRDVLEQRAREKRALEELGLAPSAGSPSASGEGDTEGDTEENTDMEIDDDTGD